tara:strand:+ start:796 stop:1215 length:420 start_codon:yes stop_codon:yes gene_type:complete
MHRFRYTILKFSCIFFVIQLNTIFSQQNKIIIQDNWDQTTDKLAHSTTSFGIYYTLRYFDFSRLETLITASLIGLSYEVYQINDPRETDSDFKGISIQDMGYNSLGIIIAFGFDHFISATKTNFNRNLKEKSYKRSKPN